MPIIPQSAPPGVARLGTAGSVLGLGAAIWFLPVVPVPFVVLLILVGASAGTGYVVGSSLTDARHATRAIGALPPATAEQRQDGR